MSDGHFNRCILPHEPFGDGIRAGRAQMKMKALEAFRHFLDTQHPEWNDEQKNTAIDSFRKELLL
jgi:hypothetical protein